MRNVYGTVNTVLHFTGYILIVLGVLILVPIIPAVIYGEFRDGPGTILAFIIPAAVSLGAGFLLRTLFHEGRLYTLRAMLICGMGWALSSAVGALPFVIGIGSGYLDAYFETMSGFTTTGITMYTGLDLLPRSILFWRALTQLLGGLGILSFFLIIAFKGAGAHKLYGAESHKIEMNRPVPGFFNTVKILWGIYLGFTAMIFLGLWAAGMSCFDGLCHSFTALSTGGYSPHDASIAFYRINGIGNYRLIEYITIAGMLMGGMNFLIHYRVLTGNIKSLFDNIEMKYFWGLIGGFLVLITAERYLKVDPAMISAGGGFWNALEKNFRDVLFQVTSILTTTGFGTRDIAGSYFGHVARMLFLAMMFIGGCVGSTGGGFKVLRVAILSKLFGREIFRLRIPAGINKVIIDGSPVDIEELQRVASLFFFWIVLLLSGGLVTAFLSEFGAMASLSGMFSALGNIGPCYIPVPEINQLNPAIKLVYIFGMLAGRLELLPVIMLLNIRAWKN